MAKLTPMRAIRKKCLDCCVGQIVEVRECKVKSCPLYAYRMGKRPVDNKILDTSGNSEKYPRSYIVFVTESKLRKKLTEELPPAVRELTDEQREECRKRFLENVFHKENN